MRSLSEIRTLVDTLVAEQDLINLYPRPVVSIAGNLGYQVFGFTPSEETKNVAGMVDYISKRIYINETENKARMQFTIAHEIGHIIMHKGDNKLVDFRSDIDSPMPSNEREIEANKFAAELLMDRDRFKQVWEVTNGDREKISQYFGVSKVAANIRASVLGIS